MQQVHEVVHLSFIVVELCLLCCFKSNTINYFYAPKSWATSATAVSQHIFPSHSELIVTRHHVLFFFLFQTFTPQKKRQRHLQKPHRPQLDPTEEVTFRRNCLPGENNSPQHLGSVPRIRIIRKHDFQSQLESPEKSFASLQRFLTADMNCIFYMLDKSECPPSLPHSSSALDCTYLKPQYHKHLTTSKQSIIRAD